MALQELGNEQGYLKAGFLGYAKSGKSFTATKLAIGVKKFTKHPGPVAFFDTESGSPYIAEMVKAETGQALLGVRKRSFEDLMQFCHDCIEANVSVAIIDSITHPWKEICDSYLVQLNERRAEKRLGKLMKLEFSHWNAIKQMWEAFPNFFLNSEMHIIICGRAGAIWEMEKNEESGRRELIKTGVKMKTESELGFESSLLIEMEREQVPDGKGGFKITHIATILGDRFGVLDGATCENPTFEFFLPHVSKLAPGKIATVDTTTKTATGADVEGGEWEKEKRQRTIFCEEIQGALVNKYPGQTADEKKSKADILQAIFGTRSWTKVENMQSAQLKDGLERLRKHLGIDQEEVSQNETDDLDFGPTKPQGKPTPTETPAEPQKPQGEPTGEAGSALLKLRTKIQTDGGLTEERLIQLLRDLGSTTDQDKTLEIIALRRPNLLNVVADNWATYVTAAKEWK
jgi:hypothetical protein